MEYDFDKVESIFYGVSIVNTVLSLIFALLVFISIVLIFKKAGRRWWETIIPIYNLFVFHQIIGLSGGFTVLYILSPIIMGLIDALIVLALGGAGVLVAWIVDILILGYFHWKESDGTAKSFNKDIAWSILIFLFEPIMLMIIAFSKNIRYGSRGPIPQLVPRDTTPSYNFDPNTGQPINNEQPVMNFDPNTGQPLNNIQPTSNVSETITPNTDQNVQQTPMTNMNPTTEQSQPTSNTQDSIDSIIIKQ